MMHAIHDLKEICVWFTNGFHSKFKGLELKKKKRSCDILAPRSELILN